MSQRCPECRLYNPDSALRCDCGYDFQAKEKRPSYVVAAMAQKHGGIQPLLQHQSRRNIRRGLIILGVGFAIGLAVSIARASLTDGHDFRFGMPVLLMVWGAVLVVRGYSQRNAAADLTGEEDSSGDHWVDRS